MRIAEECGGGRDGSSSSWRNKFGSSALRPLSRTVPEAVADTEGRGFAMSGAVSQLVGHLWGEVVKHGPTVRPFASANAEGLPNQAR